MNLSNGDKRKHGESAQNSLGHILQYCKERNYLEKVTPKFRVGKEGYGNKQQFYAPFLIEFLDGTKWALFTTTSMRTDRIKGQQWDAKNLKEIDEYIQRVYLIYPDGLSDTEQEEFVRQGKKYVKKEEYSAIDEILSQDQITNLIENYSLKDKTNWQKKDIQGNNFEERVACLLSYNENLKKWKTGSAVAEGLHYDAFQKIVKCFELDKEKTKKIDATADKKVIGKLPSGGNPKTDVLATVTLEDNNKKNYTISCKRSSDKSVSVHQYTAETFAKVLDPDNIELKNLLYDFQNAGSLSAMGEQKCLQLEEEIAPYVPELSMWVLSGENGDGDPETQWAKYILTYDNNEGSVSIHKVEDYYKLLTAEGKSASFGTPFSWTYPSKRRGESIQLKCKIIK